MNCGRGVTGDPASATRDKLRAMPHTGPILEGRGDTDYERYIRVPELLELVKPAELLAHPEERLFQTTHQTAELWLHHVDYEIARAVEAIRADEPAPAAAL